MLYPLSPRLTQARDSRMSNEEDYLRYLPPAARPYLDKELDWDNDGVERDLCEIADQMSDWETKLAVPLGLTLTDIHDIKSKHPNQPVLQRYYILGHTIKPGVNDHSINFVQAILGAVFKTEPCVSTEILIWIQSVQIFFSFWVDGLELSS